MVRSIFQVCMAVRLQQYGICRRGTSQKIGRIRNTCIDPKVSALARIIVMLATQQKDISYPGLMTHISLLSTNSINCGHLPRKRPLSFANTFSIRIGIYTAENGPDFC